MLLTYVRRRGKRGPTRRTSTGRNVASRCWGHRLAWTRAGSRVMWGSRSRGNGRTWWRSRRPKQARADPSGSPGRMRRRRVESAKSLALNTVRASPFFFWFFGSLGFWKGFDLALVVCSDDWWGWGRLVLVNGYGLGQVDSGQSMIWVLAIGINRLSKALGVNWFHGKWCS